MIKSKELSGIKLKLLERNIQHTKIYNVKEFAAFYDFGEILGQGVFGTVMEVKEKRSRKIWAVKIIDKLQAEKHSRKRLIEREIQILKIVNHPHIIYLDRIFESTRKIYLVIEKCNIELADLLKTKKRFTEQEGRKVIRSLSSAVAYLHKYEIVHRDLKLENILTAPNPEDRGDPLYIKITDFGLSIIKTGSKPGDFLKEKCGTLTYMAPEIISRRAYTHQCDVWAMGVCAYTLLFGKHPFYSQNEKELQRMICERDPTYKGHTVSAGAMHLLGKMLTKDPALRITAAEVEHHAWVRGENMVPNISENVLDMMRLWRSEMMVVPTGPSVVQSAPCLEQQNDTTESTGITQIATNLTAINLQVNQ